MTKELIEEARNLVQRHIRPMEEVARSWADASSTQEADKLGASATHLREASLMIGRLTDALEAATRVPVQGEPNDDREALASDDLSRHTPFQAAEGSQTTCNYLACGQAWPCPPMVAHNSRATVPDAATELAAIKARADEVGEDEGWHIGGAWGDYGEVVVPLRILSYVVDGALDEKVVSTDPGYAATYAEQMARADRAEAERDAALAAVDRVRAIHSSEESGPYLDGDKRVTKRTCIGHDGAFVEWPCPTVAALDGAPEPEEKS